MYRIEGEDTNPQTLLCSNKSVLNSTATRARAAQSRTICSSVAALMQLRQPPTNHWSFSPSSLVTVEDELASGPKPRQAQLSWSMQYAGVLAAALCVLFLKISCHCNQAMHSTSFGKIYVP